MERHATGGWADNVGRVVHVTVRAPGDSPVDDSAAPRPRGWISPTRHRPHRPGGHFHVLRTGRLARPWDRCPFGPPTRRDRAPRRLPWPKPPAPKSATSGAGGSTRPPPSSFWLQPATRSGCHRGHRSRRLVRPACPRSGEIAQPGRPQACEARPADATAARATDCHRGQRHALARRVVLVLAATGQPGAGAGAGLRFLRLRPAPRRRDRATASRRHRPQAAPPPVPALRSSPRRGWTTTSPSSACAMSLPRRAPFRPPAGRSSG